MNNNIEQLNKIIKEKRENRKERIKADIELYGRKVLESEEMKSAYDQPHHIWSTVAEHTLRVTASSVLICYVLKKLHVKVNLSAVVIAALCHDLGMLDRGEKFSSDKEAIREHAEESVKVARNIVDDMPELAEKIIETHMWPMGKSEAPNTVEGVVVSVADKYTAFKDLIKGSDANDTGLNNKVRKYKDKLKEAYYIKKQQLGERFTAERGETMKGNEFNDLWVILNNMPEEAKNAVPERYKEFVRSSMLPDGESDISTEIPIDEQIISSELRGHLACLNLTYWANGPEDRREFAESLHKKEMDYQGKPDTPMTEEEYQEFLEVFDEWNELFGPIPFWAESRNIDK